MSKLAIGGLLRMAGIVPNGPRGFDPDIKDDAFYSQVWKDGGLGLGEAYVQGHWECLNIEGFLLRVLNSRTYRWMPKFDWRRTLRAMGPQTIERAKIVAEVHYNDEAEFFKRMLGESMIYTCARWEGVRTLADAQRQKLDLLSKKAELYPGATVLDIGCGWGGYLAHAAQHYQANGIGITISEPQLAYAQKRYANLPVEYRLQDYRLFEDRADSIVSICMIEHVGAAHLRTYFHQAHKSLCRGNREGVFALQCIVAKNEVDATNPWLEKHIFPNSALPTRTQLQRATAGLFHWLDEEYFGRDYVTTLKVWRANLERSRDWVIEHHGIEHYRKYFYYLSMCIAAFLSKRVDVAQFVLSPTPRAHYRPIRL